MCEVNWYGARIVNYGARNTCFYFIVVLVNSIGQSRLLYNRVPSSKYVVYATACLHRELYGKITDRKENCVNNYLI